MTFGRGFAPGEAGAALNGGLRESNERSIQQRKRGSSSDRDQEDTNPHGFFRIFQFALKYAMALAESFKARLYVVHVCEHAITGAGTEAYHFSVPEFLADVEKTERESLEKIVSEIRSAGIDAQSVFTTGRAYIDIVDKAKELEVDLITLATHGRKGLSHFVFGSTAEKIVRLAPCPVLTVKHPEHDFVK
jgi:nucleotide-binding universal stress UspA family protein